MLTPPLKRDRNMNRRKDVVIDFAGWGRRSIASKRRDWLLLHRSSPDQITGDFEDAVANPFAFVSCETS
ncbi:hypothetical protein L1887_17649 [Cichorium endivia]|nr:hypothetical protein L1887_17649 [Cichorium endivia]